VPQALAARARLLAVAAAVALTAAPGGGGATPLPQQTGILGRDDRVMLDPTDWPWTALGRVNRENGGYCSGALVGPDLMATAAHCLTDARSGRTVTADELHVLVGYRRGSFLGHGRVVTIIRPDGPAPTTGEGLAAVARDWAILVLAEPLTVPPVPVRALAAGERPGATADEPLLHAGYGRDRPHLLSLDAGCRVVDRAAGDAVLIHTCDAAEGASGSPLLLQAGGHALFAIHTGVARVGGRERGVAVHAAAFLPTLRRLLDARAATVGVPSPPGRKPPPADSGPGGDTPQ